jgi:hypothetical protein
LAKFLAGMQVNMLDAKTRLSELVLAAERGEDVVTARAGVPRAIGLLHGRGWFENQRPLGPLAHPLPVCYRP